MGSKAIVSDIHGNLPALEAVLDDARANGVSDVWCLGDVVGYGAQPIECLERLLDAEAVIIMGNHEQAVLDEPYGFNPLAAAAIRWTRARLEANGNHLNVLRELPRRHDDDSAILVHGSPNHPVEEYLFREETLDHLPRNRDFSPKLAQCFRKVDRPCFIGHTHVPGAINLDMTWTAPEDVNGDYDTESNPDGRCIVNVGSVGQPRDGDTRASYALFDGRTVHWRRVRYDVEAAAQSIFETPELPDPLGQRLIEGW